jgi:hypothetical protein
MTYLKTPCTRCENKTLLAPVQHGTKWLSFCTTCKKNNGAKRYWNEVRQVFEFEIYPLGRTGGKLHERKIFVEGWAAKVAPETLRLYMRIGRDIQKKREEF